MSVCCE